MKNKSLRISRNPLSRRKLRRTRSLCAFLLAFCLISYGFLPMLAVGQVVKVSGSIHPNAIQIDASANVFLQGSTANVVDWVKNSDPNLDTPATLTDGIAFGIRTSPPDQTGHPNGTGNWHGVRIVDGFGGGDKNIFTKGGKVNEPQSWEIAPGSIGSSKYDATQMYIANNQTDIFFGMERNGNNGTTAFDWEFNQKPPLKFVDDPATPDVNEGRLDGYVPDRSNGDVIITFEMQGSGNASGSVATFIFKFDGDDPDVVGDPAPNEYVLCTGVQNPAAVCAGVGSTTVVASINGIEPTPAEPWGYVNGGAWTLTPGFPLRFFAEAKVSLSLLPGINVCGGAGFVAVRTRASATLSSDAKDTTKYFQYDFGGPTARATLTSGCGLNIHYNGKASTNSTQGSTGLSYSFQFQRYTGTLPANPADWDDPEAYTEALWQDEGPPISDADGEGDFLASQSGAYRAKLTVTQTSGCDDEVTTNIVVVFPDVGGSAELVGDCDDDFTYSATGTGGSGRYSFFVEIFKVVNGVDTKVHEFSQNSAAADNLATPYDDRTTIAGLLDIDSFNNGSGGGDGRYKARVTISDFVNANCTIPKDAGPIEVRHPLGATIAKTFAEILTSSTQVDSGYSVPVLATLSNHGSDTIEKQWERATGGDPAWANIGTNSLTLTLTMPDLINFGTTGGVETADILGDSYKLRRSSLQVRVTVTRTLNGQNCPYTSDPTTVRALKAIDP